MTFEMKATIEQHLCLVLCIKFLIHANLDFEKYIVSPSLPFLSTGLGFLNTCWEALSTG